MGRKRSCSFSHIFKLAILSQVRLNKGLSVTCRIRKWVLQGQEIVESYYENTIKMLLNKFSRVAAKIYSIYNVNLSY